MGLAFVGLMIATRTAVDPLRRSALLGAVSWPVAGYGQAAPPPPAMASVRRFGDLLGLVVKYTRGEPMSELPMLTELGVRWVRDSVRWPALEPAVGRYADFDPAFRERLAFYREHGIGLVALLTLDNPSTYPGVPGDPHRMYDADAFGRFAAHVTRLLTAAGVRFVIEVGNEPHSSDLARRFGGQWQGRAPSAWVDHYVRMVHAAVREVKSVDTTVRVLTDDDMWVVHYWFVEAGLPPDIDAFAIHPYTGGGPPERTAVAHDTDWTRPFAVVDPDRSFASAVRRLRAHAQGRLGRAPQTWITEWGWQAGGEGRAAVSEALAAAYLPRAFIVAALAGVEVMCWFSSRDTVDGPMGLVTNEGRRRPSHAAFKTLSAQLADTTLEGEVRGRQPAPVHAVLFRRAQGRTLVVWSEDAQRRGLPLPAGTTGVDHLGRALVAGPSARFDAAPIYLTGAWSDESVDTSLAAAA